MQELETMDWCACWKVALRLLPLTGNGQIEISSESESVSSINESFEHL